MHVRCVCTVCTRYDPHWTTFMYVEKYSVVRIFLCLKSNEKLIGFSFCCYSRILRCILIEWHQNSNPFNNNKKSEQNYNVLLTSYLCSIYRKGVFIATQSTELNWPSWTAYSQVSSVFVYDVTTYKLSQLLFTLSSWVELCLYKHPLSCKILLNTQHSSCEVKAQEFLLENAGSQQTSSILVRPSRNR